MASAIAWRSAGAVGALIAGKLGCLVWDEATLLWSFKDDVDTLRETMVEVNAMMHDADRRSDQDKRELVGIWMNKFKSVACDVEDLLDKFEAIEVLKRNQSKIKTLFSSCNPLFVRLTMAQTIKKVKKDLDIIKEDGCNKLHLKAIYNTTESAEGSCPNEATVPWTNENIDTGMIGRDTEKEKILKLLLKTEAEDISIIPIIGLGGLGKTTLAQAVFSDKRTRIFDLPVWVFVSKKFDLQRIGEKILSTATIYSGTSERHIPQQISDLSLIMEQLKTILPTKRYLIVLDDIWEEGDDNLEKLEQMLQYGMKGSKIILTTRMAHVVQKLDTGVLARRRIICSVPKKDWINLSLLSHEDCWHVMREKALGQDDDDIGGLEEIGREIAKKCQGLPLLARSFGFLLSQQDKSTAAWERIRDREIILGITEDHQSRETMERLMLSYYYLPFHVKLCFAYCAVFPQGFSIARDHLIQQWRALGYISADDHYCINFLLGMSFLHISKSSQSTPEHAEAPIKLTMHDLVHDLAKMIAGNEIIVLHGSQKAKWSTHEKRYCRHMQLTKKHSKALKEFPEKIRSLHATDDSGMQLRQTSFSKYEYLRVLDLRGCSTKIEEEPARTSISLPSSIHRLLLLRYLDASGLSITELPTTFHKLQKLQTLIMSDCALETLPDNIGSLLNLCYLDLSGNRSLNKLPVSFGELSAVSFLKLSGCSKLAELPESIHKFECLRHLDMSGCCALQKLPDKFGGLPKLLFLNLSGCSKLVKLPDSVNLKSLEHLNLSSCHELQSLPEDFGILDKLKFLNLSDCYKLQVLPESFCQLKHLKNLDLSDCHDLKELPERFGNLSELHSLNLSSCSKLRSLPDAFGDLSKLKHLKLSYCVRFEKLPCSFCTLKLQTLSMSALQSLSELPDGIGNMTSLTLFEVSTGKSEIDYKLAPSILRRLRLRERIVHNVHDVQEEDYGWCSSIVSLGKLTCQRLQINGLHNVKCPEDAELAKLRNNPDLRELNLFWYGTEGTENRRDAEVLENLVPPRTLEGFELRGYMSRNFPNWMVDISSYLPYLTSIRLFRLESCYSLPPLGMLPNLRLLSMEDIHNIKKIGKEFYGEQGTCKRLRVIQLTRMNILLEWWTTRSGDEDDEFLIPNLHRLEVTHCTKLKFLPCPPKSMYWDLHNSDEVLPIHGFGRLSSSTLPFRAQIWSFDFSRDKWGRLQHLTTLEELVVKGSSSVSTFPEASPCFPSLRYLEMAFPNLQTLPEWLGQLTTLEELSIFKCFNLTPLPASIQNLTALKKLQIRLCPRLVKRCKGEDAHKISHIPEVIIGGERYVRGQLIEESRAWQPLSAPTLRSGD
ncbi:unnamed protein product [Urochloa decumbens]|uniref:Uncharacterized protein n=1 Tax=Urochloa decumbens TaxID=240449 RepID=A0ABC8WA16_9POAL